MWEPYLCIGGVEVANAHRTLSYLRNVGHPYLLTVPDPNCKDCYPNLRPVTFCQVPYGLKAGFDRSVNDELGVMVTEMFRGAETVERIGLHRETALAGACPPGVPPVPKDGWVTSDYLDEFRLPLLLTTEDLIDCSTSQCRFERWMLYDLDRWPVPDQSPPLPGEASGAVSVMFYIDACSVAGTASGYGYCAVSFDDGLTWFDPEDSGTLGQVAGSTGMRIACTTKDPAQFTFETTADTTGFCHHFDYALGGSGVLDVQVWVAPSTDQPPPPLDPFEPSHWSLVSLGSIIDGRVHVPYDDSLCGQWSMSPPWLHKFWRFTDRMTRAVYELAISIDDDVSTATSDWTGLSAYSLDGGRTWHDLPATGNVLLVTPPQALPMVPITTGTELGSAPFTTPVADEAPWLDPNEPDSEKVLGVWIEEFNSSVPWKREVRQRAFGGSLPRGQLTAREIHITGYCYTRSCEATDYAKRWLFEALAQESCSGCDLPDAVIFRGCDPLTDSSQYARTIRRVGLTAYNPELEPEFPCCLGFKFEATLVAEVPYLYRDPVTVYSGPIVDPTQDPICNICAPCPVITAPSLSCGCLAGEVPVVTTRPLNECYCAPARVRRLCVPIDPAGFSWSDATVRLTLEVGGSASYVNDEGKLIGVEEALRNLRIVGYANPLGLDTTLVGDTDYFECQEPCVEVEVACMPPNSTLVVDGSSRRSSVNVGPVTLDGYGYLSSGGGGRFNWPDVGCKGLMLCFETDSLFTNPDALLTVELVPRERA